MTTTAQAIAILDGLIDGKTDDLATHLNKVKDALLKQKKVHVRDLPACEQDIVVNMDDEKDFKTIDSGRGINVARILIWKGGKRQVAWFGIGCYRNKAILQITAGKKNRTETKKKITCQPWLPGDKAIPEDAPEGV
jgi:hypothetical protein